MQFNHFYSSCYGMKKGSDDITAVNFLLSYLLIIITKLSKIKYYII